LRDASDALRRNSALAKLIHDFVASKKGHLDLRIDEGFAHEYQAKN
jgi:hypothetical protein